MKPLDVIGSHLRSLPNDSWAMRHWTAWRFPLNTEIPIVSLFKALAEYAEIHQESYTSKLGRDSFLGREWMNMARGLRGLLNGNLGRLDGGTLDKLLHDLTISAGFGSEELSE